ncbi:MAG: alpha/beta hydrolase [Actinomycetaceae bacterium]|nr:alpha/beta hydrolase [Actinomycetaceae bacterium]
MNILLLHGSMSSSVQWYGYDEFLQPHNTLSIDLPGHGDLIDIPFTLRGALDTIDEAVTHLHDTSDAGIVLVGHSLGGYIALKYAAEYPTELAGLVLIGASANPTGPLSVGYRGFAKLTEIIPHAPLKKTRDRVVAVLGIPTEKLAEDVNYEALPQAWRAVMEQCPPSLMLGIQCPILLLNGQFDQMRVNERQYLVLNPGAHLEIIPRATHLAPITHAEEVGETIRQFANACAPPL